MQETVPDDFPRGGHEGAVPGFAPKYVARERSNGQYVVGLTEEELQARHFDCCTLALGMMDYCQNKQRDNPSWSSQFLMDRTGLKIASEGWGYTDDEITWVLKRMATALKLPWEPGSWRNLDVQAAINGVAQYSAH